MCKILKFLKYVGCAAMLSAIFLFLWSGVTHSSTFADAFSKITVAVIFLSIAGMIPMAIAIQKKLFKSKLFLWLYLTFIPVISWIDVVFAPSKNITAKNFNKFENNESVDNYDRKTLQNTSDLKLKNGQKVQKGSSKFVFFIFLCIIIWGINRKADNYFTPYYYVDDSCRIYYKSNKGKNAPSYSYILAGLDMPDVTQVSNDIYQSFMNEARELLQLAIKSGDINLELIDNHRGYVNHYVYVWLGIPTDSSDITIRQKMLNAILISKGFSKYNPENTGPEKIKINQIYDKVFFSLQKEAQDNFIGIWGLPENSPEARTKREEIKIKQKEEAEKKERELQEQKKRELKKEQQEYLKEANTVVVTPRGKKYHYSNCRTVRDSYRTLTIKQARKKGYKPCGVCSPPDHEITLENCNIYWGDDVYSK